MTVDQLKDTYDRVGKLKEVKTFLAECRDDTQLSFDMSGFCGDSKEKACLFSRICAQRLCILGIKAFWMGVAEAIEVAVALSFEGPQLIEMVLLALSPIFAKNVVEGIEKDFMWDGANYGA